MNLVSLFFITCASVSLQSYHVVSVLETNTSCYCVRADDSEDIDSDLCRKCSNNTLSYFAKSTAFSKNHSTFYFAPGPHSLFHGITVNQHDYNLSNLALIGLANATTEAPDLCLDARTPAAIIQCEGNAGFYFANIISLTIACLEFRNCGFVVNISSHYHSAAIVLESVWNLNMSSVRVLSSNGWGLLGEPVNGISLIKHSVFDGGHSVISHRHYGNYGGGNVHFSFDIYTFPNTLLTIEHTNITNGHNIPTKFNSAYGSGMHIYIKTANDITIRLDSVYFSGNIGRHGGNVAVSYTTTKNGTWPSSITFVNCQFLNGSAEMGGGVFMVLSGKIEGSVYNQNYTVLKISKSQIADNTARKVGAGVYVQLHEDPQLSTLAMVEFSECVFDNNSNLNSYESFSHGGAAFNLINFIVPGCVPHHLPQYSVSFNSCKFTRNRGRAIMEDSVGSGTIFVEENAHMVLNDCLIEDNNGTGIIAVHSNIVLEGSITIRNNHAYNGGGFVMCANSILFLNSVTILIEHCHADNFGGAIYTEFECSQASPPCFFQTSNSTNVTKPLIHLYNNTATRAGTAIYGGTVDYCYAFGPYNKTNKTTFFDEVFDIHPASDNDLSTVSSNPIRVCFCTNSVPACDDTWRQSEEPMYPGGLLSVSVVVVGQRNGTVPGLVEAVIVNDDEKKSQVDHFINTTNCTTVNYTILSDNDILPQYVELKFYIGNADFKNSIINAVIVPKLNVTIVSCPYGFSTSPTSHKCDCSSWVNGLQATCNITMKSIYRSVNSSWWIGELQTGNMSAAIYSTFCPFDYCVRKDIHLQINETDFADSQCANHRSGILCGACKGNWSKVLGSNSCRFCHSPHSILRMLGLIVLFALLGIVFVFLVGILDITVSEGTLNAIIFYMNVVRVNTSIFFDSAKGEGRVSRVLEVFVAWMNLDLGIEMCFYDGMGTIGKTALQIVFPVYLCVLSGLIIFFSRKSSTVTNTFGKNVVKILATVIFHLYAKILRTVIAIMQRSEIIIEGRISNQAYSLHRDESNTVFYVWTVDGTIPYLHHNRHTILFIFAVAVIAVTLPYTLALLFIQCLRRWSNMKVLFWVNKLKPFFDAYTGPYKDKYHFWTGFLLVVRISLFISIAVNTSKGEALNLTLICTATAILFVMIRPGIYKSWVLNLIEVYTYANLTVLAAGTIYDSWLKYGNDTPIIVCVGSMFLLFCGIVVYHILKKLSVTQRWGLMKVWLLDRSWPWMKRKQIRSLILPYVDPDNDEDLSSSDSELDPILHNAPPVARYDQYREPLIGTTKQ